MKRAIFLIVALVVFSTITFAQGRKAGNSISSFPHLPTDHAFKMTGTELAKGTYDEMNDKCWGNTYMISGLDNSMEVQFTYSMDYVSGDVNVKEGNFITHGMWTMAIFENGRYAGTVYGEIIGGSMHWEVYKDLEVYNGIVGAKLQITGGSGDYEYVSPGMGSIQAYTDFTQTKASTSGTLMLTF